MINKRVFAIACNHLDTSYLRAETVGRWSEVTAGRIPIASLEHDYPDVLGCAKVAFVFMDFNPEINPEIIITDSMDFAEQVEVDTHLIVIDPSLAYSRLAHIICNSVITHLMETRNGKQNTIT